MTNRIFSLYDEFCYWCEKEPSPIDILTMNEIQLD